VSAQRPCDCFVGRIGVCVSAGPSGPRRTPAATCRAQLLPAEYAGHLDRPATSRPHHPTQERKRQSTGSCLSACAPLPHVAERRLIVIIDRQANQSADFDPAAGTAVAIRCSAVRRRAPPRTTSASPQRAVQWVVAHDRLLSPTSFSVTKNYTKPSRVMRGNLRQVYAGRLNNDSARSLGVATSRIVPLARGFGKGLNCRKLAINRFARKNGICTRCRSGSALTTRSLC